VAAWSERRVVAVATPHARAGGVMNARSVPPGEAGSVVLGALIF